MKITIDFDQTLAPIILTDLAQPETMSPTALVPPLPSMDAGFYSGGRIETSLDSAQMLQTPDSQVLIRSTEGLDAGPARSLGA